MKGTVKKKIPREKLEIERYSVDKYRINVKNERENTLRKMADTSDC